VSVLDEPRAPRAGEQLDLARLEPWVRQALDAGAGAFTVAQFPAGHSNLTYLVRVGEREAVLRRPPFGSPVKSAHDMGREVRVLRHLAPLWPRAPRVLAACEDAAVIGAPFYLMERRRGVVLRRQPPPELAFPPAAARRLSEAFVDTLAELHSVDYTAAGLGGLGNPEGYVARQVSGWTRRWTDARTDAVPEMDAVAAWLDAHLPPSSHAALIHNDFKYDNLVLDPDDPARILGVLDWEMATLGDPLMDLGTALCYWVEEDDPEDLRAVRFGPTTAPGTLTRRALVERYGERMGRPLRDVRFYYAFGLFKTAVVAQQIYYRYAQGLTADARFAGFIDGVRALARQAARVVA
jgi:aminoglycoside phosphotransferase (APT) family kinase protein